MTSPLVFKAFNLIQELNHYSYAYLLSWDRSTRQLHLTKQFRKLVPWHIANIVVVFLLHFCLSVGLILYMKITGENSSSNKQALLQFGALGMMSCHSTASYGINYLLYRHSREFVPFYNALLKFEVKLRERYVTEKEIKAASILKDLNPKRLANRESDMVGLVMLNIIHILTVVPAITPISLVVEDVDPFGIFLKKIVFPEYDSLSKAARAGLVVARLVILVVAMLEISQTFRTAFNFGLSVFHIYRKCLEVPCLATWQATKTIAIYNQFHILHSGIIALMTPLGAFFLGLNFIILTISTVICLTSHRILPIQIYVGIPAATAMAYFLLFATLPFAIYCHEETKRLHVEWRKQMVTGNVTAGLGYWKRVMRTLRPLSFYCGDTGVLTQKTKGIYMSSVVDSTVTVLLGRDRNGNS